MCYWYSAKKEGLVWSLLCSSIVFIVCQNDLVCATQKGKLIVPIFYTALSGDLSIQLQHTEPYVSSEADLSLKISRLSRTNRNNKEILDTVKLHPEPRSNITQISVACHNFMRGGMYELEVVSSFNRSAVEQQDERLKQQLDVRWPTPKLSVTPELIGTYPEEPVEIVLSFPEVKCEVTNMNLPGIPEFWLELSYCGQEVICPSSGEEDKTKNSTTPAKSHVIYAEQVRGFPKIREIKLRCELFGLAGHYIVQLKPVQPVPSFVSAATYIRADWNEKFVFNVHARSIFPCDPHTGIGVLFEYPACILDQADRVRLFAKLRADVASLKPPTSLHYVTEQRVIRGQHSLHFDCDFFSEKYVEYCFVYVSQAISGAVADIRMDCVPTLPVSDSDTGGWGPWSDWTPCSTTCYGGTRNRYRFCDSPPPRYGAKFCEGSAVETEHCGTERADTWECLYGSGDVTPGKTNKERLEVSAEIGPGCRCGCIVHLGTPKPKRIIASSAQSCPGRSFWLIQADDDNRIKFKMDFFRLPCSTQYVKVRDGDSLASTLIAEYIGGAHVSPDILTSSSSQVLIEFFSDESASIGGSCNGGYLAHAYQIEPEVRNVTAITSRAITQNPQIGRQFTIVHIAAVIFASIIIIISALLGAQYMLRYRKYHLTESRGEVDSPIHTPRSSVGSLQTPDSPPSRAISTTTLLSEVIYLVKIRPRGRMKHSILRESVDVDTLVKETGIEDEANKTKCEETTSISSTQTLTNETMNFNDKEILSQNDSESICSKQSETSSSQHQKLFMDEKLYHQQNPNTLVSSPFPTRNANNIEKTSSKCASELPKRKVLYVREDDAEIDTTSLKTIKKNNRCLRASAATLTNGMYSPAASTVSTATIRTNNEKESKEKQNRQKLLARPDSEFSLANPEELELDYYDYNVFNAGAAPGSYLGMDPAYLVWIPPLDEGNIIVEVETTGKTLEPQYEEILPRFEEIGVGSNTETPEDDSLPGPIAPPLPPAMIYKRISNQESENMKNVIIQKKLVAALLKEDSSKETSHSSNKSNQNCGSIDSIPLNDFSDDGNVKSYSRKNVGDTEKETSVVKSPSDILHEYYELDDIQFADDDDSTGSENTKSTKAINHNTEYRCKI